MKEIIKKWHDLRDEFDTFINGLNTDQTDNEEFLSKSVFSLGLSTRLTNRLRSGGIDTCGDLLTRTKRDYYLIRNFGKKSLTELEDFFNENGLKFKE